MQQSIKPFISNADDESRREYGVHIVTTEPDDEFESDSKITVGIIHTPTKGEPTFGLYRTDGGEISVVEATPLNLLKVLADQLGYKLVKGTTTITNDVQEVFIDHKAAVEELERRYRNRHNGWIKVAGAIVDHFLGAVPPIYAPKGFACGEAYDYRDSETQYFCFRNVDKATGVGEARICSLSDLRLS